VLAYVLRRLGQSVLTIFGVMVLTFLLFRVMQGDIAAPHVGQKASEQKKADWRHRHGYDRPWMLNVHRRLLLIDHTSGPSYLRVEDGPESRMTRELALIPSDESLKVRTGRYVFGLDRDTPIDALLPPEPAERRRRTAEQIAEAKARPAVMVIKTSDRRSFSVNIKGVKTCGELMDRILAHPDNVLRPPATAGAPASAPATAPATGPAAAPGPWSSAAAAPARRMPAVEPRIAEIRLAQVFDSQFVDHLWKSVSFQAVSLVHKEKLTTIIWNRAPKSLALTVPSMALGWALGLLIASVVAYYRDTLIDKVGVFLSVLGMCIPFLAFMIYGQWLMFAIAPRYAHGLANRGSIFVPIVIMTIAGLGASVRFYRTVILDETGRDYVRTARAKGLPLAAVLFKHVLKNCMLPILTNLVMAIPFLIMG